MKEELAQTYEQVFSGPPWNEYKVCTGRGCNTSFGLETKGQDVCPCPLGAMLAPFYPRNETLSTIEKETERNGAVVEVKRGADGKIIGFVWGYPTTIDEFINTKYKTGAGKSLVTKIFSGAGVSESFFYFSETGVIPIERGKGISNEFSNRMVSAAQTLKLPLIMRTNWQSPMVAVAARFNMQQIMGPIPILDNGQIRNSGTIVNAMDLENLDRVLFIKPFVRRTQT